MFNQCKTIKNKINLLTIYEKKKNNYAFVF